MSAPGTVTQTRGHAKRVADTSPGPWKRWRRMSRAARAIKFIQTYCAAPKGENHGKPIRLAKFQKDFIEQALADGIDFALLATPRGNGKSTYGGALATWAIFDADDTGAPQVPIIATTVTQAIRSCYGVGVQMIEANPELLGRALIYTGIGTARVVVPANGGEMFPIANDPDGLQGLDYSFALVDEIGFQPVAAWDSLSMAAGKRSRSLAIGVGTPGFDENNALHHIRKLIHEGADIPGILFVEYAADEGCDINDRAQWRQANPALEAGFLRESALATDAKLRPEGHFRIFRLGQWTQGVDSWLGPNGGAIWEGLTSPWAMIERPGPPVYVGVDIALKSDTSAVVSLQQRPDGRYHATARIWRPTADRPVDVTDVMQHLRELFALYPVEAVGFDSRFFDVPAKMLEAEGLPMVEVPQSLEVMTPAYTSLFAAIMEGKITHDGDAAFATQILNAVPRFSDRGFTLEKRKSRGKIDAASALAMAFDRALREDVPRPSVYEERGLVSIG